MVGYRKPGPLGVYLSDDEEYFEGIHGAASLPGPLGVNDLNDSERTRFHLPHEFEFHRNTTPTKIIAWGKHKNVTAEFKCRIIEIATHLEMDVNYLMAAMAFESGESFDPAKKNTAGSGAVGLIQFMPATATSLGTTVEALAKLTAVEQLDYVARYFEGYKGKLKTLDDVYMAILWPKGIGKPDDYILFDASDKNHPKRYIQNKGLDYNHNGEVTKAEAVRKVRAKLEKGLSAYYAG